jgi:hypothetical protein
MAQNVAGFGGKIQLNYHTSNTQTMTATSLTRSVCIPAVTGQRVYVDVWKFEPTEAACLYETNICARICNCNNKTVPGYAAFVRHVYDFDPDHWRPAGWLFDHPVRFMVADPEVECDCP